MKIGIFDSGLGGLSIYKEIMNRLPQYDYIYLGDNARVPYGGKSPDLIHQYTKEAVEFLFKKDCQLIILACNSATVSALRKIQQQYLPDHYPDRRVLGVVIPALETAFEQGEHKIGVIATQTTVNSDVFKTELTKQKPDIEVIQKACPLLVPIIEAGEVEWEGLTSILNKYLEPIKRANVHSLILGCTHYGLIEEQIQQVMGPDVHIINEGKATAEKLEEYLHRHPEIESQLSKAQQRTYYVTDFSQTYIQQAEYFLKEPITLEHVSL